MHSNGIANSLPRCKLSLALHERKDEQRMKEKGDGVIRQNKEDQRERNEEVGRIREVRRDLQASKEELDARQREGDES